MLKNELRKLFSKPLVWIIPLIFLGIIFVNDFSIVNSNENKQYMQSLNNYLEMPNDSNLGIDLYFYQQRTLVTDYQTNLQAELDNNQLKKESDLFNSKTSQNRIKVEDGIYHKLQKVTVSFKPIYAAENILSSPLIGFLMAGWVIVIVYYLFIDDRQTGFIDLMHSTQYSFKCLVIQKLFLAMILLNFFAILAYGINGIVINFSGLSLNSHLQNIVVFQSYPAVMSIGTYLLFQMLDLVFKGLLLTLLLVIIYVLIRNTSLTIITLLGILLVGFLMEYFIDPSSPVLLLKYFNFYSLIFTSLSDLILVNIFNIYFKVQFISMGIRMIICLILGIIVIIIYPLTLKKKQIVFNHGQRLRSTSLFAQRSFKILYLSKSFLVIILVVGFMAYQYFDYQVTTNSDTKIYRSIQEKYLGKIDNELLERINSDAQNATKAHDELIIYLNQHYQEMSDPEVAKTMESLSNKAKNYSQLNRIKNEINAASESGAKVYISSEGYEVVLGINSTFTIMENFLFIALTIVIIVSGNVDNKKDNSLSWLTETTKKGRKTQFNLDMLIYGGWGLFTYLMVEGLTMLKLSRFYQIKGYDLPLNGIVAINTSLTYGNYLLVSFLIKLLIYILILELTYYLARRFTPWVVMMIMGLGCLGLVLGSSFNLPFSLSTLLTPNWLSNLWLSLSIIIVILGLDIFLYLNLRRSYK